MRPFLIVSISDDKKEFSCDIEVPTDLPVSRLAADIREVLAAYAPEIGAKRLAGELYCTRLERSLQGTETFGTAGLRMGDTIVIR